ncbi:MAG: LysR family transcriptional regulator [Halieaceae bacterium]|nr:LysR family transcriptional regulator [Halieaceae bacterium]
MQSVATAGGISAAARELHLTQPAVSMQLKELEGSCGVTLYERSGRGIQLTTAGETVLNTANAILDTLRNTQEALDGMIGLKTGVLKFATVSTAKYFAPSILSAFRSKHPEINVQLVVGNRQEVIDLLNKNTCDLVIMGTPPIEVETKAIKFAIHPQVIIAAQDHPLSKEKDISLKALRKEGFVIREMGSGTRAIMERYFSDNKFDYQTAMEASSNETIKQAVIAGMGLSFNSKHTIALKIAAKRLSILDIKGMPLVRAWHAICREDKIFFSSRPGFFQLSNLKRRNVLKKTPIHPV